MGFTELASRKGEHPAMVFVWGAFIIEEMKAGKNEAVRIG